MTVLDARTSGTFAKKYVGIGKIKRTKIKDVPYIILYFTTKKSDVLADYEIDKAFHRLSWDIDFNKIFGLLFEEM